MLLGAPDTELVGVTTVADGDGRRAGYAAFVLDLAGCAHVPVVAGAARSLSGRSMGEPEDHRTYWGDAVVRPRPNGSTSDTLADAVRTGARIVAIGPLTNLAELERNQPGLLSDATVVMMGGWLGAAAAGLPEWGPDMDWNVQCDPDAASIVFETVGDLTIAPLAPTLAASFAPEIFRRSRTAARSDGFSPVRQSLTPPDTTWHSSPANTPHCLTISSTSISTPSPAPLRSAGPRSPPDERTCASAPRHRCGSSTIPTAARRRWFTTSTATSLPPSGYVRSVGRTATDAPDVGRHDVE